MKNICPICYDELELDERDYEYNDYRCLGSGQKSIEHFYVHRILDDKIIKIKFRIENLYLKINYDDGFSQAWMEEATRNKRVNINHVFELDFSDLEKIKRKIKILLTFS